MKLLSFNVDKCMRLSPAFAGESDNLTNSEMPLKMDFPKPLFPFLANAKLAI